MTVFLHHHMLGLTASWQLASLWLDMAVLDAGSHTLCRSVWPQMESVVGYKGSGLSSLLRYWKKGCGLSSPAETPVSLRENEWGYRQGPRHLPGLHRGK